MRKHYLITMTTKNGPQQVLVCRGWDEASIRREIIEERELIADEWDFDFYPLDEHQARTAEGDPEYYYMTKFG